MSLTGHAMSILDSYVHGFAQQEASLPLDPSGDLGGATKDIMAQQEQKFILGAVARGIKRDKAQQVFSLMAQFADYGFPKAHSVAYAYLAYQTAYLKAHYPEHFFAAVLSNEIEDTAKVFRYAKEMRGQGIELLPPDVNESEIGFTPLKGAIRYGLAAIKGIGFNSVTAIVMPGQISCHGKTARFWIPSAARLPHEASGA